MIIKSNTIAMPWRSAPKTREDSLRQTGWSSRWKTGFNSSTGSDPDVSILVGGSGAFALPPAG